VYFYAVVNDEINRVLDFFPDRQAAEAMLAEVFGDEPDWESILRIERIELVSGAQN
jgi:hypothetical protein